jgi:hypothetical protein
MSIVLLGSTSGSCTLQEQAVAGTTTLTLPTTSGTVLTSASSVTSSQLPVGSVLQVVQTVKTDTFTMSSSTFADITGLSVSITPSSSSNKILVLANVNHVGTTTTSASGIRLMRDSTAIGIGDAAGSRPRTSGGESYGNYGVTLTGDAVMFLDSPATTSATTYKIQIQAYLSTAYVNRSQVDTDNNAYFRGMSSITVMEISA